MRLEELELSAADETTSPEPAPGRFRLSKRCGSILLFLVAILPIAALFRLIGEYGVNVPYRDDWSLVPLFVKWNDHQLAFADLLRPHNEHRIFFPKLIYLAFAQITHWNVRAEMFFSRFTICQHFLQSLHCVGWNGCYRSALFWPTEMAIDIQTHCLN